MGETANGSAVERKGRKYGETRNKSPNELPRKASHFIATVPQTDTGRWGENP